MKKNILAIFLLSFFFSASASAGTCWNGGSNGASPWSVLDGAGGNPSAAYVDVNYCVNTVAGEGDTVILGADTATWTTGLSITKPIRIEGQTTGCPENCISGTTINSNGTAILITVTASGDDEIDISGLTLDGNGAANVVIFCNSDVNNPTYKFRLHENEIRDSAVCLKQSDTQDGAFFGLIDNNHVSGCTTYDMAIYGGDTANLWTTWPGEANLGTENYLYIEDNIFTGGTRFNIASGRACRWVLRHNQITMTGTGYYTYIDFHGDVNNYGGIAMEVYENDFISNRGSIRAVHTHGGTNIIFNNTAPYETGSMSISMEEQANGGGCIPINHEASLPINNTYTWNNIRLETTKFQVYESDTYGCIAEKTDWWDDYNNSPEYFTSGLSASRPATAAANGDVYWAMDTKKLYRAITGTTWTQVYTPYEYPHPGQSGEAPPDPPAPVPFSGLRVTSGAPVKKTTGGMSVVFP